MRDQFERQTFERARPVESSSHDDESSQDITTAEVEEVATPAQQALAYPPVIELSSDFVVPDNVVENEQPARKKSKPARKTFKSARWKAELAEKKAAKMSAPIPLSVLLVADTNRCSSRAAMGSDRGSGVISRWLHFQGQYYILFICIDVLYSWSPGWVSTVQYVAVLSAKFPVKSGVLRPACRCASTYSSSFLVPNTAAVPGESLSTAVQSRSNLSGP